jgi:tetratricopeptide (TPR) repeat protein
VAAGLWIAFRLNRKMEGRAPHPGPPPIGSAGSADAGREKRSQRLGVVETAVGRVFYQGSGCQPVRRTAAALIFFVAALSPMLGFIPLYTFYFSYVADHYQYLACLGPIALAAGVWTRFVEIRQLAAGVQMTLVAVLLLVLGVLTFRQCEVYRGHETLWRDTLKKNPQSWMAHANLARLRVQQGRAEDAEQEFRAAIGINPSVEGIHYNLGNLLAREERYEEAIAEYHLALEIAPGKAEAHNNLGVVLNRQHRSDAAEAEFKQAIFYEPDYADAYYNLGNAFWAEHKMDAAVAAYEQAVRLNPAAEVYRSRLQAVMSGPK